MTEDELIKIETWINEASRDVDFSFECTELIAEVRRLQTELSEWLPEPCVNGCPQSHESVSVERWYAGNCPVEVARAEAERQEKDKEWQASLAAGKEMVEQFRIKQGWSEQEFGKKLLEAFNLIHIGTISPKHFRTTDDGKW